VQDLQRAHIQPCAAVEGRFIEQRDHGILVAAIGQVEEAIPALESVACELSYEARLVVVRGENAAGVITTTNGR
jgi:hypothetical protein